MYWSVGVLFLGILFYVCIYRPTHPHSHTHAQCFALNGALLLGSHFLYHRALAPLLTQIGLWVYAWMDERYVYISVRMCVCACVYL
jgi:Na+-translocating ferredoxin:NAD+ oxidoreductase RnfD subunit